MSFIYTFGADDSSDVSGGEGGGRGSHSSPTCPHLDTKTYLALSHSDTDLVQTHIEKRTLER